MLVLTIKNLTAADIAFDNGRILPASGTSVIDRANILAFSNDDSFWSHLNAGDISVNDGTTDLTTQTLVEYVFHAHASHTYFSKSGFLAKNVHDAISESRSLPNSTLMFQLIGKMNYDQYLVAGPHSSKEDERRSGDSNSGAKNKKAAPAMAPYTGQVYQATVAIRGVAQSTGTPGPIVSVYLELWDVAMTGGEGTKLGDIIVPIDSTQYTIGKNWNSNVLTDFKGIVTLNPVVPITGGHLLGLKFVRYQALDKAVSVKNTTVMLGVSP